MDNCPICGKKLKGFDLAYLRENGSCMDCDTEENEDKIKEALNGNKR
jgi:hypothetical protein